jgi:hypothetical protein
VGRDGLVVKNIPLDPIGFDWNQFAKSDRRLLRFYRQINALQSKIANGFFTFGFIASVVLLFLSYQPLNIAIAVLYTIVGAVYSLSHRAPPSGLVEEKRRGWPVPFAILRVFSFDGRTEVAHSVCDKYGRYYCLVPPGDYRVQVERRDARGAYEKVLTQPITAPHGIIRKKFRI